MVEKIAEKKPAETKTGANGVSTGSKYIEKAVSNANVKIEEHLAKIRDYYDNVKGDTHSC